MSLDSLRVDSLVDRKAKKEMEKRLLKLKEGTDAIIEQPIHFTDFFYSEEGKTLGRSIAELTDFSMKTAILSFPFDNLMLKLKDSLHSDKAEEEIQKIVDPTMSERYRVFLSDVLLQYTDLLEKEDIKPPFSMKDMGRFLVLHVLSLYSYLDVYADSILNKLMENKKLLARMIKKLESEQNAIIRLRDLHRYLDSQEDALVRTVKRNLPRNLLTKIDFIVMTVGIEKEFAIYDEITGASIYRGLLSKLVNLRNIFAHGEPSPDISSMYNEFKDAPIKDIWRGFLRSLNIDSEDPLTRIGLHGMMMEVLVEQGPLFSVILTTMIIALMYPLIVDTAISTILE